MTQEEKDLILRDLCARLPYGVKIHYTKHPNSSVDEDTDDTVQGYYSNLVVGGKTDYCLDRCKPYLRPISSMTEEERKEYQSLCEIHIEHDADDNVTYYYFDTVESFDWLNKNMFDFRGLIPKGQALSTEEFNPYKD